MYISSICVPSTQSNSAHPSKSPQVHQKDLVNSQNCLLPEIPARTLNSPLICWVIL